MAPRAWPTILARGLGDNQTGRLMAPGLIDGKRFAAAPEIPTIAESGVPGFARASGFIGLFAPAGTSTPIVKKLSQEVAAILATPSAQATARTPTSAIAYADDETFRALPRQRVGQVETSALVARFAAVEKGSNPEVVGSIVTPLHRVPRWRP